MFFKDSLINSHYQPDNILLIESFEGKQNDRVLLDLIPFLTEQHALPDMRQVDDRYVAYRRALKARLKKEDEMDLQRQAESKAPSENQSTMHSERSSEK